MYTLYAEKENLETSDRILHSDVNVINDSLRFLKNFVIIALN